MKPTCRLNVRSISEVEVDPEHKGRYRDEQGKDRDYLWTSHASKSLHPEAVLDVPLAIKPVRFPTVLYRMHDEGT